MFTFLDTFETHARKLSEYFNTMFTLIRALGVE